jgi:hypothetical protein
MPIYTVRADYILEADNEEQVWELFAKGQGSYDGIYDIIEESY